MYSWYDNIELDNCVSVMVIYFLFVKDVLFEILRYKCILYVRLFL